jgi:hypothetical protein
MNPAPRELYQNSSWTPPIIISSDSVTETVVSWFPDLAVDENNHVHVVWCHTAFLPKMQSSEEVAYAHYQNAAWSRPNDIVAISSDLIRSAIATDLKGKVHLLYGGSVHSRPLTLYYTQADVDSAWSAQKWLPYQQINRGVSYMGDIAVDSRGTIHIIYDDRVNYAGTESTQYYADIFYRNSTDGGFTWSTPVNLANSPQTGSARPYLEIGSDDVINVTWDEGWDRLSGNITTTLYSAYTFSADGGNTWSTPKYIDYPADSPSQLTVGSTGLGGVMLVWRSELDQRIYYQWSADGGLTWSLMPTIHGIFARPWTTPFDMYDMATDSNGNIHLIVVGQLAEDDAYPGVFHLVWDGKKWSEPEVIYQSINYYPEYPKIVISEGNQLHAVWFTRKLSLWDQSASRHIWYSTGYANSPRETLVPLPTHTVPLPTATKTPVNTATPKPTVNTVGIGVISPTTENEYLKIIAIALLPVVLLIGGVFIVKTHNRSSRKL